MKDIEFGLLAQIAYYNWHKFDGKGLLIDIFNDRDSMRTLTSGKSEGFIKQNTAITKEITRKNGETVSYKVYNEEDKRLFMTYSEDQENANENPKYKEIFSKWEFIEGSNHEKIYNEAELLMEGSEKSFKSENGFQVSAFKKGNDIMIAYRGTDFGEDTGMADFVNANIPIGINTIPEHVICSIYFYDKIRMEYPEANIYITGHSLGGALAQFVTFFAGNEVKKTITWNGLGVWDKIEDFYEDYFLRSYHRKWLINFLKANDYLEDEGKWLTEKLFLWTSKEIYRTLDEKEEFKNKLLAENISKYDESRPIERLVLETKMYRRFSQNIDSFRTNRKGDLIHFYFEKDIVKSIKSKIGTSINVNDFSQPEAKGSVVKVVIEIATGGFPWHSINNFIPYADNKGNIIPDKVQEEYIYNAIKTLVIKQAFGGDVIDFQNQGIEKIEEAFENLLGTIKGSEKLKIFKKELKGYRFKKEILKELKDFEYLYRVDEEDNIVLGKFTNYEFLAGVAGMEEITLGIKEMVKKDSNGEVVVDYLVEEIIDKEWDENRLNFLIDDEKNILLNLKQNVDSGKANIFYFASSVILNNGSDERRVYFEKLVDEIIKLDKKDNYLAKGGEESKNLGLVEDLYNQASKKSRGFSSSTKEVTTLKAKAFYKSFLDSLQEEAKKQERSAAEQDRRIREANRKEYNILEGKPSLITVGKKGYSWNNLKDRYKGV